MENKGGIGEAEFYQPVIHFNIFIIILTIV